MKTSAGLFGQLLLAVPGALGAITVDINDAGLSALYQAFVSFHVITDFHSRVRESSGHLGSRGSLDIILPRE